MKHSRICSRLFIKYFVSYLLVFVVPLSAMFILFQVWSHTKIQNIYIQRSSENLDMLRSTLDNEFSTMNRIGFALSQTTWVRNISSFKGYDEFQSQFDYSATSTALDQLENWVTVNGFSINIALYFPRCDAVVYKDGIDNADWFFERSFHVVDMVSEEWDSIFAEIEVNQSKLIGPCEISRYNISSTYFLYIRALAFDVSRPKAYALFYIPQDRIVSTLEQMCITPNSYSLLLDENGTILFCYSSEGKPLSDSLQQEMQNILAQQEPPITASLSDNMQMISFGDPTVQRFQLVNIYSQREVLHDVIVFQRILIGLVVCLSLLCLLIAFFESRKNEAPVRRIAKQINLDPLSISEKTFSEIENNITLMLQQKAQFLQSQEEYTYLRLRDIFEAALNRSPNGFSERNQNFLHRQGYSAPHFCVVVAQCAASPQILRSSFLSPDGVKLFMMARENQLILIANSSVPQLKQAFVLDILHKCQCGSFSAGAGGFSALSELSSSYNQARIALDFQLTKGVEGTAFYDQLDFSEQAGSAHFFSVYISPLHSIHVSSDWVKCAKKLLSAGISQSDIAATVQRTVFCKRALMALEQLPEEHLQMIGEEYFPSPETLSSEEISRRLEKIFYKLYSTTITQRNSYNQDIAADIKQYIDNHYTESNLSLGELADHFEISSSKMSILFKSSIGETFVAYLSAKRIRQAQALLAYPDLSIEEIGKMCGFENVHSFRRVFKKIVQIPPSDYRESLLSKAAL